MILHTTASCVRTGRNRRLCLRRLREHLGMVSPETAAQAVLLMELPQRYGGPPGVVERVHVVDWCGRASTNEQCVCLCVAER